MPPKKNVEEFIRVFIFPDDQVNRPPPTDGTAPAAPAPPATEEKVTLQTAMFNWMNTESTATHIFTFAPGVYKGNILIKKPCEFIGADPPPLTEEEQQSNNKTNFGCDTNPVVILESKGLHGISIIDGDDKVKLRNIQVRMLGGGSWNAVHVAAGRPQFQNCSFSSTRSACVGISGESSPNFQKCTFSHSLRGSGLVLSDTCRPNFTECLFADNALNGAEVTGESMLTAASCCFRKNRGNGIVIGGGGGGGGQKASCHVSVSQIDHNGNSGVEIGKGSVPNITKCAITNNSQCGVVIVGGGGVVNGNDISGNRMHGVEVSYAAVTEITENEINYNLHLGIAAYDLAMATVKGNQIHANLWGPCMASPRSEAKIMDQLESGNHLMYVDYPDSDDEN